MRPTAGPDQVNDRHDSYQQPQDEVRYKPKRHHYRNDPGQKHQHVTDNARPLPAEHGTSHGRYRGQQDDNSRGKSALERPGFFGGLCLPDEINLPFFPAVSSSFPHIL